jgi:hypothetical protein
MSLRHVTVVFGVAAVLASGCAVAQVDDGRKLMRGLEASRIVSDGKATEIERLEAAYATGYIAGGADVARQIRAACPSQLTLLQLNDIVETFLSKNPGLLYLPAPALIVSALHEKYPCPRRLE